MSYIAWSILVVLWLFVIVSLIVAIADNKKLPWLEFLLFFSYVKLAVTLIKYVPQVRYYNNNNCNNNLKCLFDKIVNTHVAMCYL